jgi:hypothetical protein
MRLFVPLTRDELDRLRELARAQRRRPQDQAAVLLTRALAVVTAADCAGEGDEQLASPERGPIAPIAAGGA